MPPKKRKATSTKNKAPKSTKTTSTLKDQVAETIGVDKPTSEESKHAVSSKDEQEPGLKDIKKDTLMLETGHIYFFYRPKVEMHDVHDVQDVQRLYMLLFPSHIHHDEELKVDLHKRLLIIGNKKLPDVHQHGRPFWGIVEKVSTDIDGVDKVLGSEHYDTHTRGERSVEAARPCGEGVYAIVEHKGHTHLAYVLEQPEDIGEVQKAFRIEKEGSYIITVKNPDIATLRPFAGGKHPAKFPQGLKQRFEGKRWSPVKPTTFLDYEGAEILIISASDDVVTDLGKVGVQLEEEEKFEAERLSDDKLFKELHMNKKEHPPKPLLQGKWQ